MGGDNDTSAVVDTIGRVRGIRVIDPSIFPEIPSEPPNLTVIMLAEYLSAAWLGNSRNEVLAPSDIQHAS
jgi:choline dehydrogenase